MSRASGESDVTPDIDGLTGALDALAARAGAEARADIEVLAVQALGLIGRSLDGESPRAVEADARHVLAQRLNAIAVHGHQIRGAAIAALVKHGGGMLAAVVSSL